MADGGVANRELGGDFRRGYRDLGSGRQKSAGADPDKCKSFKEPSHESSLF
jgi:hypothetical protein